MEGHGQPEGQWGSVSMLLAALDNPAALLGKPSAPDPCSATPPPPPTSPARLQGRMVDSAKGVGWSKEVLVGKVGAGAGMGAWGEEVWTHQGGPWSEWAGASPL